VLFEKCFAGPHNGSQLHEATINWELAALLDTNMLSISIPMCGLYFSLTQKLPQLLDSARLRQGLDSGFGPTYQWALT